MGIDTKQACAILWRIITSSTNTTIKFIRNHPILSSVSMSLLALYIFLPSLFFFLIYTSPIIACALVYARERFSSSSSSLGPKSSSVGGGGGGNGVVLRSHLKQQRSVRRNARMKVEEWDSQNSEEEEEKDKVILTSLYNDLLGRTPHFEESPKATTLEQVQELQEQEDQEEDKEKVFEKEDSVDVNNVEKPMICNCEINGEMYRGFDGKEETIMSDVNEHGISEIERNKRLESLIARRRARRLFKLALGHRNKLQADNNNSLQVMVPKNINSSRSYHPSESSVPGSAPSVLLQGRNPFDIPYDPQEERPNLTGDSFDEEFSLFNHKDMFFCRHESFCRFALFSPEHGQCMNSPVPVSDISATRKHLDLDNEFMDHSEQKLPCNVKEATIEEGDKSRERVVEMNDETDSNNEESDNDSSCSEESECELSRFNKEDLSEAIRHSMDNNTGFLVNETRSNIPSSLPRGLTAPRLDDNNMFYNRRCANNSHSRTFSVASDMQVEVSEIGSPPTTIDWLDEWSNGGESYTYDTDIEREIIRNEESRKKVSKEESNGPETKLLAKEDQECMVHEINAPLLDTRDQTEETFEQKPSSSSDVSKPTSSVKFEGKLFHTSVSLSSITEEPETILDGEHMNCLSEELTEHISLPCLDVEVGDVKQLESEDLCGSPKIVDSSIVDDQEKDQVLNIIQGENDTETNMKMYENASPSEYEPTKSFLDASLDTPYIESFESETEEPKLDISSEDITKQAESDLMSSPGHVLTELLQSEVVEENGNDEETNSTEQEQTHKDMEASSSHPYTQLVKDHGDAEDDSDAMKLMQVQDDINTIPNNLTDEEISKEGENARLLIDFYPEETQEDNTTANVQQDSLVSEDTSNSQGLQQQIQQRDIESPKDISPRTIEITQQPEHEDVLASNTVSRDVVKDEFDVVANDSAANESNDEESLKPDEQVGEDIEKEIELGLESMHHDIGLVAKEDGEESKKMIEARHHEETKTTKDENKVIG
ncbi:unnamed protein product [Cochlearia groenlandica]